MILLDGEEKVKIPFRRSYLKGALSNQGTEVAVVICHSWGLFGGSMNEILVLDMVRSFSSSSTVASSKRQRLNSIYHKQLTTLRFNFPGLLQISRGIKEMESVIAASNFLLRDYGTGEKPRPKRIILVGYSRVSLISGSASALIPECIGSVMIGCPFTWQSMVLTFNSSYHLNQNCKRKDITRLFIHGTDDEYTTIRSLMKVIDKHFSISHKHPKYEQNDVTVKIFEGAAHIFKKNERSDVINYIHQWLYEKSWLIFCSEVLVQ